MQTPNVLETPEYLNLPESDNDSVRSISRDNTNAAWLAGTTDGEGCIHVCSCKIKGGYSKDNFPHYQTCFEVRNSDPYMVRRISQILFSWNVTFSYSWVKGKGNYKDQMIILIRSYQSLKTVLNNILPYLTTKKEEAQLMLDFIEWRETIPLRIGSNLVLVELLRTKFQELKQNLSDIKRRKWSFQRLPRRASQPLDLTNLEVVV